MEYFKLAGLGEPIEWNHICSEVMLFGNVPQVMKLWKAILPMWLHRQKEMKKQPLRLRKNEMFVEVWITWKTCIHSLHFQIDGPLCKQGYKFTCVTGNLRLLTYDLLKHNFTFQVQSNWWVKCTFSYMIHPSNILLSNKIFMYHSKNKFNKNFKSYQITKSQKI